jgi:hypothetical protein
MDPKLDKMRQTAVMLSGSFFFLVGMLAFALNNMVAARETKVPLEEAMRHPLALPLAGAALLTAVLSFVMKKVLTPKSSHMDTLRERISGNNAVDPQRASRFFAAHIVAYALAETPAIFGFVLGMSSGSLEVALPFFAVSLVLFALHFPRSESWR